MGSGSVVLCAATCHHKMKSQIGRKNGSCTVIAVHRLAAPASAMLMLWSVGSCYEKVSKESVAERCSDPTSATTGPARPYSRSCQAVMVERRWAPWRAINRQQCMPPYRLSRLLTCAAAAGTVVSKRPLKRKLCFPFLLPLLTFIHPFCWMLFSPSPPPFSSFLHATLTGKYIISI